MIQPLDFQFFLCFGNDIQSFLGIQRLAQFDSGKALKYVSEVELRKGQNC